MKRYQMPAYLGGAVIEGEETVDGIRITVDGAVHTLPHTLLAEVLPVEPELGPAGTAFVAVDGGLTHGGWNLFHRDDEAAEIAGRHWYWYWHRQGSWRSWAEVCEIGIPLTLTARYDKLARGICPVCIESRPLLMSGRIKVHGGRGGRHCSGSGELPVTNGAGR